MTPTTRGQPPVPEYDAPPEDGVVAPVAPPAAGGSPAAPVGAAATGVAAVPPVAEGVPEAGGGGAPVPAPVCGAPETAPVPVAVVPGAGAAAVPVLGVLVDGAVVAAVVLGALVEAMDCVVASADELGAVMLAIALPRIPPPWRERKVICEGEAMTIPMPAAMPSIRETAPSEAT
jgi:hypothetical protein